MQTAFTRSRDILPIDAQMTASEIVRRAKSALRKAEERTKAADRELRNLRNTEELVMPRWKHDREAIYRRYKARIYPPDDEATRVEKAEKREAALSELDEKITAQLDEWNSERKRLRSKQAELEEQASRVREWSLRLSTLRDSTEGLAPWDTEALEAYREWGDLPDVGPEHQEALTGKEVEAFFREHLRVSRSLYYARFRPLLKTYFLSPATWALYTDGYYRQTRPSSGKRWRRDELEALILFLKTGSVTQRRVATGSYQ